MKSHPTPVVWFKFHARDLSIVEWISFRTHVMRCAECGPRLAQETRERVEAESLFDDRVLDRLRAVSEEPQKARASRVWFAIPAAALAVLLFLVVRPPSRPATGAGDDLRAKGGGSTFLVYVAIPGGTDLLGERCHPGDALQAQYRTTKPQYLIVGVDPEGATRTLVPLDGTTSTPTTPGLQSLPQSWVLDAAPGRERFVAFFSDAPIDAARAREAAKQDKPALPGTTAVVRECRKGPP